MYIGLYKFSNDSTYQMFRPECPENV